MGDAGGGHFYYIADAAQIRDHIASEVGETLEVVARDVELQLTVGAAHALPDAGEQTQRAVAAVLTRTTGLAVAVDVAIVAVTS